MRDPLSKKVQSIEPSGIRKFFDIVSEMKDAISLGVGEPDFDTPIEIKDALIEAVNQNHTRYAPTVGNKNLREEICKFEKRVNKVSYEPDEVLITSGFYRSFPA